MEHWGDNQNYISSAMHTPSSYGGTQNKGSQYITGVSTEFHIYTLDWTAEKLVFSVDGKPHYTYSPVIKNQATWPFDSPQYVLLNANFIIDPDFKEDTFDIDHVRIYDQAGTLIFVDEFN